MSQLNGTKHDSGKPPMELLPWEAVQGVAQVLDHGRTKYSAHNWRGGFVWGRLAGAALRHIFSWLSGEDKDKESGLSHIDHAACCLMFLSAHIKSGLGKDDRASVPLPPKPAPPMKGWQWFFHKNSSEGWVPSREVIGVFPTKDEAVAAFHQRWGHVYPSADWQELREVDLA